MLAPPRPSLTCCRASRRWLRALRPFSQRPEPHGQGCHVATAVRPLRPMEASIDMCHWWEWLFQLFYDCLRSKTIDRLQLCIYTKQRLTCSRQKINFIPCVAFCFPRCTLFHHSPDPSSAALPATALSPFSPRSWRTSTPTRLSSVSWLRPRLR